MERDLVLVGLGFEDKPSWSLSGNEFPHLQFEGFDAVSTVVSRSGSNLELFSHTREVQPVRKRGRRHPLLTLQFRATS